MATASTGASDSLLVKPKEAWRLLSCSNTHGYELLKRGELESFLDGGSRKITLASIHKYIARKLAQASGKRGPGRPRKNALPQQADVGADAP